MTKTVNCTNKNKNLEETKMTMNITSKNSAAIAANAVNTPAQEIKAANYKPTNQRIELIALDDCAPTDYQRPTSPMQVAQISAEMDEAKLGALTVSLRDGKYHIIDGLHRANALKVNKYTHTTAVVLTGLTYEQEAELFRRINKDKRAVTTLDDFSAGLQARDEVCLTINKIASANKFQIGRGSSFYCISSVKALTDIVKLYGYDVLDDTLFILALTWSDIRQASERDYLLGIAEFVNRYGIAEFSDRLKDKFWPAFYEYGDAVRGAAAVGVSLPGGGRRKYCQILVKLYNKGLGSTSKKRLAWEVSGDEN